MAELTQIARGAWQRRPFVLVKLQQLWKLVRESHEHPLTGETRAPQLVAPGELGVTFIGHSSFFLQIGGKNILIDPVFSRRLILLRRQSHPGTVPELLPPIDLVLVTHAHMDHLDRASLRRVVRANRRHGAPAPEIVVPNGVDDLVNRLGFRRVHTLGWWQQATVQDLSLTMTPCRHWGARMFRDTHRLYGGYVLASGQHSVYHSGDTAWFDGFAEIGRRLRPRTALLPIGAYFPDTYRAVHTSPEEALAGFLALGAETMIPMHYGTFRLGREPDGEALARLLADADKHHVRDRVHPLGEGDTLVESNTPAGSNPLAESNTFSEVIHA